MISSWVTEAAPWRFEVPTQSEPVSPPPITTTCLPVARERAVRRGARLVVAGVALVLLGQEIHRELDAGQLARPGSARSRGSSAPPASTTASKFSEQRLDRDVDADLDAGAELDAFGLHLLRRAGR